MAQEIQLPDGSIAEFPDNFSDEQITQVLAQQFPPEQAPVGEEATTEPEEPGFFERIGTRLEGRGEDFDKIVEAFETEEQGILESTYQTLTKVVAGGLVDVVGEGLSTAAGGAFETLSTINDVLTPSSADPHIEERNQAIKAVWDESVGPEIVAKAADAASSGFEAYRQWAENNPRFARNLEGTANIALIFAPVKFKPKVSAGIAKPTIVGRTGEAVGASAKAQIAGERSKFITDLVKPIATKKVREAEIRRTAEGVGILGKRTVTPSAQESSMAAAVSSVPQVTTKNTLLKNLSAVQKEATREANHLESLLKRSPVRIPEQTINSALSATAARMAANPILVGDAAKTGTRTLAKARTLLGEHTNSPLGVLTARRSFDAWVRNQRPKVFDPATESALSIAVRETRQTMNDIIATQAPGVGVRSSLAKQTNLLSAMDNIGPKAAEEAGTAIRRLVQSVETTVGLPKRLINFSIGDIVATSTRSALAVGPKVAAGTAKKSKQALAAILRQSEKAIQTAKRQNNMNLVRQLRLDRAAVVEIVKAGNEK